MEKTLSRETKFGKVKAIVEVTYFNPMVDLDGHRFESKRVEKKVVIKIIANGKVVEESDSVRVLQDNPSTHDMMVASKLDLNKKYTRVSNKAITEGEEAYNNIKKAISDMEIELSVEFEGNTNEEQEEIETAEAAREVVAQAKKEGIENLMTSVEVKNWRYKYNAVNNEGEEGYIPVRISKEQYKKSLNVLK